MLTLHRLAEKQEKIKKYKKVIWHSQTVSFIMAIAVCLISLIIDIPNLISWIAIIVFAITGICGIIHIYISYNINNRIYLSVERILDHTVDQHLTDKELGFVTYYKTDYNSLYFLIEVFSDTVSYDELNNWTLDVTLDIAKILDTPIDVYIHIERTETTE